jgi:hypothetical protein
MFGNPSGERTRFQNAVVMMPAIVMMIPNPCRLVTLSFKTKTARVIVTIDKADAMGEINIRLIGIQ